MTLPVACGTPGAYWMRSVLFSPGFATDQTIWAGTTTICRSSDGGISWTVLPGSLTGPARFAFSPTFNAVTGVNGTHSKTVIASFDGASGVKLSTDGGLNWSAVNGLNSNYVSDFKISPNFAVDHQIFAAQDTLFSGLFRSTDSGANFSLLSATPGRVGTRDVSGIYLGPNFNGNNSNGVAVAATEGSAFWRSTDSGNNFLLSVKYNFIPASINAMARKAGGTLGLSDPGFPGAKLQTLAFPAGSLLAGTDEGVFLSNDGGASFNRLSKGLPRGGKVQAVSFSTAAQNNPLCALKNKGVWRFNGTVWAQAGAIPANADIVTLREDAGAVLYATNRIGVSYKSTDGGVTWPLLGGAELDLVDLNDAGVSGFASPKNFIGPRLPAVTQGSTASTWAVAQSGGPRWTTDSGGSWTSTPGGNDYTVTSGQTWTIVKALGLNAASGAREVVAGSATGLWRTQDGGDSWRRMDGTGSGLEATSKNFSAVISSTTAYGTTDLLVGATGTTTGGVYLSGDGGEHWTQINAGFDPANLSISSLITTSCTGCPVQYYSGSYGGGLYTRTVTVQAAPFYTTTASWCAGAGCACATASATLQVTGGDTFKICGSNFQTGAVVEFDGVAAGGCSATASVITCTSAPAHVSGSVTVRVRNPDTRMKALPAGAFQFSGGSRTVNSLLLAKSGSDAGLSWTCSGCTASAPARVYRSQNAVFTLYLENYNGGTGSGYTNTGAVASAQSYFWSVE